MLWISKWSSLNSIKMTGSILSSIIFFLLFIGLSHFVDAHMEHRKLSEFLYSIRCRLVLKHLLFYVLLSSLVSSVISSPNKWVSTTLVNWKSLVWNFNIFTKKNLLQNGYICRMARWSKRHNIHEEELGRKWGLQN